VSYAAEKNSFFAAYQTVRHAGDAARGGLNWGRPHPDRSPVNGEQGKVFTALLRHIIGNPFRPYPAPPSWPSSVVQLAESLYNGQDCSFALHDALLEAGHAELAEHFKEEQSHPKGCFALDLILNKK